MKVLLRNVRRAAYMGAPIPGLRGGSMEGRP
jgi:hypothetical protein